MRRNLALVPSFAVVLAAVALTPSPAAACGGFFCDASTQSPIYQAGERVIFAAREDGLVTMHVEVVYSGEPTRFSWILPIPERPMDAAGQPLPLDKAVAISVAEVFDQLQTATNPQFRVNTTVDASYSGCEVPRSGADAGASMDAGGGGPGAPPVVVLEEAKVGPYDAQLIEATSSDALFQWLNDNGYYQDPKAQPILPHYVSQGFKFIGVKLQNAKTTDDLKPLAITLSEGAPCVPLRLTGIAATPGMPIMVWVLGQGRAVPKNFIHAVVNDQAIRFPSASNYAEVVSAAVDAVAGRAWVTEFAGSTEPFRGTFLAPAQRDPAPLLAATELAGVLAAVPANLRGWDSTADILRDEIAMPAGLKGYPHGNCYYDPDSYWGEEYCPEMNADHVTTEAEFYGFLDYWAGEVANQGLALTVDLARLKQRLADELIVPLAGLEGLLAGASTLTRFFTTLDPEEMTKDPIFAFNPALPDVDRLHTVEVTYFGSGSSICDEAWMNIRYADGTERRETCPQWGCPFGTPTIAPVADAPALKTAQVLDETGAPVDFDPAQAEEIDTLLDGAVVGQPSLPAGFEVKPPSSPPLTPVGPGATGGSGDSGGCSGAGAPLGTTALALLLALALLALRRREG